MYDLFLVSQRKPLEEVEPIWWLRWLLRRYYKWRGFACRSHCECDGGCYASIEYRGIFSDEAEARWWASCPGGAYKPIPFNGVLPQETVAYLAGDAPHSEASHWYRTRVDLPFHAIPRDKLKQLERHLSRTK